MKYVFGVAFLLLGYAVYGVASAKHQQQPVRSASVPTPPVAKVAVSSAPAPTPFKIIRVVADPKQPTSSAAEPLQGDLVKDIQRRLADAQCFAGPVDGVWTPETQGAMQRFIIGARAELSSAQPDSSLVALLRARKSDTSLCSTPADQPGASVQAQGATPPSDATLSTFSPPMGLGGPNSSESYRPPAGADSAFRHPLGTF